MYEKIIDFQLELMGSFLYIVWTRRVKAILSSLGIESLLQTTSRGEIAFSRIKLSLSK